MTRARNWLEKIGRDRAKRPASKKIFHPRPRVTPPSVHWEGDTFVVTAPELERIVAGVIGSESMIVRGQLKRQLHRLGVDRALMKAGVKAGDRVRCGDFEWEWQ
jgi:Obg family GTPase CgtA-like protein